jgi:DDE superfamily endonuclease
VQRQYTGTAGRVENAQVAVYLTYVGRGGHALIDRRLYLPNSWASNPARRAAARIPEVVQFATKPALATEMIGAALDAGVPAAWVAGDEVYGADPGLRAELERRRVGYVLAVAKDHHVSAGAGKLRTDAIAARLPRASWQRLSAGPGAKGHRYYDWAWVAIEAGRPGCHWLLVRRNRRTGELAYYRCWSPRFAYLLGKLFWADLEAHHPGIDSLKLPREVAAARKQRVMTRTRTTTGPGGEQVTLTSLRLDGRSVLSAVRAFYLDIAEWADDDPARSGPWAVRCPVSASDVSHKKDRSRRKRTRERLPVLPALIAQVDAERTRTAALLAAAEDTRPGEPFTSAAGQTLRRAVMSTPATGRIWAEHVDGGPRQDPTFEEHRGFRTGHGGQPAAARLPGS